MFLVNKVIGRKFEAPRWELYQRCLALMFLALAAPVFLVLFPLVRLTSSGPFLYRQRRPGQHGELFETFKIRTMRQGSDKDPDKARSVTACDPAVTAIGRVLRDLKIDELPQLWNVVRGEMNLVGPRPIAATLQQELEEKIPGFQHRLLVKPGLTSLAQVCVLESGAQDNVVDDWAQRFRLERHYLARRSASYDFIVLLLTVLYVARKSFRKISTQCSRLVRSLTGLLFAFALSNCGSALDLSEFSQAGNTHIKQTETTAPKQHPAATSAETVQVRSQARADQDPNYRIGVGDHLKINVFGEPGMEDFDTRVDADGRIQLPIIELIDVAGLTEAEVQAKLKALYGEHFIKPWIIVKVAKYRSRPVYMLGELNQPGVIYLDGPTDVIAALGRANGMTEAAYMRGAQLLRQQAVMPVDIHALLREGQAQQNVWLEAGDTIFVPGRHDLKVFVLGAVDPGRSDPMAGEWPDSDGGPGPGARTGGRQGAT